jgi:biopolymer transport protein ExbD
VIAARLKRNRSPGGNHNRGHGMPALVPMIDMLVILVVYMLVHTADYEILPNTKNISIPQSESESRPHESTVMMVTREMIFVNGTATARVADVDAGAEAAMTALRTSLKTETEKRTLLQPNDPSAREVTVLADKKLPYSLLKKIMMTATAADVGKLSLAVIEKERTFRGLAPG